MTDDEKTEIEKLLVDIRKKIVGQEHIDGTTTWDTVDSVNYKDSMIDTSHWMINPTTYNYVPTPTITPLTQTQIHNMGIGTTGSTSGWSLGQNSGMFDINKYQNKEFETHLPGIHKINEMCEMFPAFKKAYDHMRTVYDLVHDEYLERKKEND